MDKLIELLVKNPILLLVLLAWVAGAVNQQLKKKSGGDDRRTQSRSRRLRRKAKDGQGPAVQQPVAQRQQQAPVARQQQAPVARQQQAPVAQKAAKSAGGPLAGSTAQTPEQIAREMRRILGLEQQPSAAASSPAPPPPIKRPPIERPPEPIRVSTSERTFETHVDPHVGERIRDRHLRETRVGKPRAGRDRLGSLGGRVEGRKRVASAGNRYSLDDLRKAIVINEILSPPVSVRSHEDRRPG